MYVYTYTHIDTLNNYYIIYDIYSMPPLCRPAASIRKTNMSMIIYIYMCIHIYVYMLQHIIHILYYYTNYVYANI